MALLLNIGDTVQRSYSYTKPSPNHISQPQECGDRTANLFDRTAADTTKGYISNSFIRNSGEISSNTGYNVSVYIAVTPETDYTIVHGGATSPRAICWYDADKQYISGASFSGESTTVLIPANGRYVRFSLLKSALSEIMLVEGTTAPTSYIPYGFQLPLTLGQTQNVYLSEPIRKIGDYADSVSSDGTVTRRIKKLVLTGSEEIDTGGSGSSLRFNTLTRDSIRPSQIFCTHFKYGNAVNFEECDLNGYGFIRFNNSGIAETADEFKSYLSTQYAAGTPVTVWYVLATPTTETITAPTLTPQKGSNTLSVDTTLQPSEVSITGEIQPL